MSALCGWVGEPKKITPETSHLQRMIKAAWHDTGGERQLEPNSTSALITARSVKPVSMHECSDIRVAVVGNLYWKNAELKARAERNSDACAIAQAYKRNKENFLNELHGSFALALIDADKNVAILAIDPLGIEKLCYGEFDGLLVFSTSVQGVKAHPFVETGISSQAIFNYFYFHCIPAPETIYEGIYKLQPGEMLRYSNNEVQRSKYWQLQYEDNNDAPLNSLVDEFHQVLDSSVTKPLGRFQKIGAFLSGGTDSSCVTAGLTRIGNEPAKTFSIGFDAAGYDESDYAQISVNRFKTQHHDYYVTPQDVYEAIPKIAAWYDEPFGNESAVPTYFCAKLAKDSGIDNLLAGDGGDEIFAGNTRYLKQQVFEYYFTLPEALRTGLIEPVVRHFPLGTKVPPVRKLQSYIEQANIPLPDRLETYNFLHRNPACEIFSAGFLEHIDTEAPLHVQRRIYDQADCNSALNRMLWFDLKYTLADNDLRKVNGMCDLAGVNVSYPLLDMDMVKFSAKVPANLKIKGHKLRYFFKYALRGTLAKETLTKSKHGFGLPFGLWLNSHPDLNRLAIESLDSIKKRDIIHPAYIDGLWENHRSGHTSYYGVMIWQIMMLECWLRSHE